jgi:putative heme-binding domain-containing protein
MRLRISLTIGSCLLVLILSLFCFSQRQNSSPKISRAAHSGKAQQIFAANCSGCHGLDGTGSQRAPNIVSNPQVERLSDSEIHRIISHGVPGTGMPAFQYLGTDGISSLVSYLRSLQGSSSSTPLPGDPKRGEEVFFGSGQCASCHMLSGKGGFIGPDLTSYAQTHRAEKIKQAIDDPAQRESRRKAVTAITSQGEVRGVVLNEDNFSLQLETLDGDVHSFTKADLKELKREQNSIMPSDYASRLGGSQLDDLVSYLITAAKKSAPVKSDLKKEDDE